MDKAITAVLEKKKGPIRLSRNSKLFKTIVGAISDKKGEEVIALDLRKIDPKNVVYWLELDSRWVASTGVSLRIVRNFGILKIPLPLPTLLDQYNTDPGDVAFIRIAIIMNNFAKKMRQNNANKISNNRFIAKIISELQKITKGLTQSLK